MWSLLLADLNIDFCSVACYSWQSCSHQPLQDIDQKIPCQPLWSKIITQAITSEPCKALTEAHMGKRAEMKEFQLYIVLMLLELMINIYYYTCSLTWLWLLFIKESCYFHHFSSHLLENYQFCWGFLFPFCMFWQAALNKFCRRQQNRIWISHSFEFYTNIIHIIIRAVPFLVIKWLFGVVPVEIKNLPKTMRFHQSFTTLGCLCI